MASLWSSKTAPEPEAPNIAQDASDVADTGLADVGLPPPTSVPMQTSVSRPQLSRNQPAPPPPHQPPPPPAPVVGSSTDSLSLMQLRRIITEFPRIEPTSYTFEYNDTAPFEEEINEWFSYNQAEYRRLLKAKDTFERRWKKFAANTWQEADGQSRERFIKREINGLHATDLRRRCKSLQTVLHLILGIWDEFAGGTGKDSEATESHLEHMKAGISLFTQLGGISVVYDVMRNALTLLRDEEFRETKLFDEDRSFYADELDNVMTIFYLIIEGTRNDPTTLVSTRSKLLALNPSLMDFMTTITARLRWDEASDLPQTRIFLLLWKSLLLVFGGTADLAKVKAATDELVNTTPEGGKIITASPLDYHIFRQEITSKYPAYTPPPPLIPLEPDNNSILPPLPNRPSRASTTGVLNPATNTNSSGASILHQPVHIATPAPSPPPSPPVGGKAGKKQNYQTNQNFPFLYPPLDSTSNSAGGKGLAGLQEALVGRKWEGSDIPKSILEAGELFAERMRMTRAMRQLWDERERFLKFERGWTEDEDDDVEEIDLDMLLAHGMQSLETTPKTKVDYGPKSEIDALVKEKLDMVEAYYEQSLPHLQSIVIVLLKAVLANVTALITQPMSAQPQSGVPPGSRLNGQAQNRAQDPANIPLPPNSIDPADMPIEEIEAMRSREITAKAVSGLLLMMLKWFKVSHILKFEYMTQLLLDSNYPLLVLKLCAHQEIDKVVESKTDRDDMSFFAFCNGNSKNAPVDAAPEDDDDAAPPPIKSNYATNSPPDQLPALAFQEGQHAARREAALEEPALPSLENANEPISEYSWRNFFSSINFLRIMQKICKNKAHRNLLLVQYKSSNILKKALKVPQPELRLYTLKLFKNQVPYCGRKWRSGNMRVITAVYLHCRPELRDEWLAGGDVDAEVEEALPLEQALRSLTHWFNIRRYPRKMGVDTKVLEEERDFFVREAGLLEQEEAGGVFGENGDGWAEGPWA